MHILLVPRQDLKKINESLQILCAPLPIFSLGSFDTLDLSYSCSLLIEGI